MSHLSMSIVLQLRTVEHVIARLGKDGPKHDRRHLRNIKEWCQSLERRGLAQWARQYRIAVEKKMGAQ